MRRVIAAILLFCLVVGGCKLFTNHQKQDKSSLNEQKNTTIESANLNPCDSVKRALSLYWKYNEQTKLYHCSSSTKTEEIVNAYIACLADSTQSLPEIVTELLGRPNEKSELVYVYYEAKECFTFRTIGESESCYSYNIHLSKTKGISIRVGIIIGDP